MTQLGALGGPVEASEASSGLGLGLRVVAGMAGALTVAYVVLGTTFGDRDDVVSEGGGASAAWATDRTAAGGVGQHGTRPGLVLGRARAGLPCLPGHQPGPMTLPRGGWPCVTRLRSLPGQKPKTSWNHSLAMRLARSSP